MGKVLYLGTDLSYSAEGKEVIHYPVIRVVPKNIQIENISKFTHFILTSKNAVEILCSYEEKIENYLQGKCLSIGPATTKALQSFGIDPFLEAKNCSQEGLIEEISSLSWEGAYICYPRSSLARPFLAEYLQQQKIAHQVVDLYDTVYQMPYVIHSFDDIEEVVFTSSSTVKGFFRIFTTFPPGVKWKFQGPITEATFWEKMKRCNY